MANDEQAGRRTNREMSGSVSYDEVDVSTSAGYKPMITIAFLTIASFFLFGGGLPIYWGEGEGYTLLTYGSVLWGITVIALAFIYEFWVERNESQTQNRTSEK